MKYCSKCGKEILDEAIVCVGCGCSVEQSSKQKNVEKKRFCYHCGNEIANSNAKVCLCCGCLIDVEQHNNDEHKSGKKFIKNFDAIIFTILGLISIVCLYIPGYFVYEYLPNSHHYESFYFLTSDWGTIVPTVAIIVMSVLWLSLILCLWVGVIKKRHFPFTTTILTSLMFVVVVAVTIWGRSTFNDYNYILDLFGTFLKFSVVFYVEIAVLLSMVALSILNAFGIYVTAKRR